MAALRVEHPIIKRQTFFIRLRFITAREEACPGNRHTEAFKPHLSEEGDILFIVVIEIIALAFG